MRTLAVTTLLLSACAAIAPGTTAAAEPIAVTAGRIKDGDSLVVSSGEIRMDVRLAGIDAPETAQTYGPEARKCLEDIIAGRRLTLDPQKRDKYGRLVSRLLADGEDVSLELARRGCAWHYVRFAAEQSPEDRTAYAAAQEAARAVKAGLWAGAAPVPPWDYRKRLNTDEVMGDCRKTQCRQMTDCAEAVHHLQACKARQLDRDGDGIPCESLCGGPLAPPGKK
jgi:endonuclease YncB( thermonuclease family)